MDRSKCIPLKAKSGEQWRLESHRTQCCGSLKLPCAHIRTHAHQANSLSMNSLDNDYFKAKYLNKCTLFGSVCVISIVFYIRRKCLYKITKICHICSSYDVIKADSGCIHDLERLCAHTEKYQWFLVSSVLFRFSAGENVGFICLKPTCSKAVLQNK